MADRSAFVGMVGDRALVWRRIAFLICGDWNRAEDLLQQALLRMFMNWHRIDATTVDAYARKVLVRLAIDEARRPYRRSEVAVEPPEKLADAEDVELTMVVRTALSTVPPRQRAALVLRYYQGLSIAETAEALGVSQGTVASQTSRGLNALRAALGPELPEWTTPTKVEVSRHD